MLRYGYTVLICKLNRGVVIILIPKFKKQLFTYFLGVQLLFQASQLLWWESSPTKDEMT